MSIWACFRTFRSACASPGVYDLTDFVVVLLGYAISGERTLEGFYERVQPFAHTFMALFGREQLPHRSTLFGHCRSCPLREHCQESATTLKARRVSAVYWPVSSHTSISGESPPAPGKPSLPPGPHPVLWGDWQRRFHRRELVKLLHHQRVDIELAEAAPPAQSPPIRLISRAERAHWRLSWVERLARNARPKTAPDVLIRLFGIPDTFATSLGLRIA